MAKTVKEQYGEKKFDIITFVPFSKAEKHDREFNQSELWQNGSVRSFVCRVGRCS